MSDIARLPVLETERLTLTPVSLGDFDELCALWADPGFVAAITGRPLEAEEVWFRLLRDLGHWTALGRGNWSIRLKTTSDYVGSVGVLDYRRAVTPPFDAPEMGWGVGSAFQGQGLAHEALQAALAWADDVLVAPSTVCMISPENGPSIRLAERVGFVRYADGTYKDHTVQLYRRPGRAG